MSTQAIVDPEALEQFARELKQFNAQLAQSSSRLRGALKKAGETWRDQEYQKFSREFDQTMRVLNQFTQSAERQVPFLLRKAQRARDYLRQR